MEARLSPLEDAVDEGFRPKALVFRGISDATCKAVDTL